MDSDIDVLLSIAEIAVAFSGFAALASVIGRRSSEAALHGFERLKTVVSVSLLVVVAALIPIVPFRFELSEASAWQVSSIVALLLNWLVLWGAFSSGQKSGIHKADKLYTWIGYTLEVPLELVLFSNVLMLFPNYASALYLAFLILCICQVIQAFFLLLVSLFRDNGDEKPAA
jgi:hypothetical protein